MLKLVSITNYIYHIMYNHNILQISKSEEVYNRACEVLSGGVSRNTVYRKPHPHYVESAKGCYITDIDGVERVDFANNMASLIHGHAHPAIIHAVKEQLHKGTSYTMASEVEVYFAQMMCERVPWIEKIRFVNSGTEAVMGLIKTARAFTGKPKIAKAEGAYHGSYDFAEISQTSNPSNWGDESEPVSVPVAHGTPSGVLNDVIVFPFNNTEKTIAILEKHKDEIAGVLIDLLPHRVGLMPAKAEFIEAVYNWTRQNETLLIFDEVVSFRTDYSGAAGRYKVTPDLTAFGKIIGGGFPVGAFGGRSDVMKVLDPREEKLLFPHSGTFSANPITMTAGYVAMDMFDTIAVTNINELGERTISQIGEAISLADVPVSITGTGSMFRLHLRAEPPVSYREAYQPKKTVELVNEILDYLYFHENILLINTFTFALSTAITQKEIDKLSDALFRAFVLKRNEILQVAGIK